MICKAAIHLHPPSDERTPFRSSSTFITIQHLFWFATKKTIFFDQLRSFDCWVNSDYTTHNSLDKKPNTTNIAKKVRIDLCLARERRMRYSLITINSNEKGLESLRTRIKIGVNILCVVSISNIIILVYNISQAGVREQTSYENLITIILTALAVILTVMTVGLAIFSYYGYHKVIEIIENTVGERVEGLVKDYVDEYYVKNQPGTIMDKLNQIKDDDV